MRFDFAISIYDSLNFYQNLKMLFSIDANADIAPQNLRC